MAKATATRAIFVKNETPGGGCSQVGSLLLLCLETSCYRQLFAPVVCVCIFCILQGNLDKSNDHGASHTPIHPCECQGKQYQFYSKGETRERIEEYRELKKITGNPRRVAMRNATFGQIPGKVVRFILVIMTGESGCLLPSEEHRAEARPRNGAFTLRTRTLVAGLLNVADKGPGV